MSDPKPHALDPNALENTPLPAEPKSERSPLPMPVL